MTLAGIAECLSSMVDRPVLDMTGLPHRYDISLEADAAMLAGMKRAAGLADAVSGADRSDESTRETGSIFAQMRQLGLKLKARKAPVQMVVVVRATRVPKPN